MVRVFNIACAAFAAFGSFLFGYDSGIIGSILVQEHFLARMGNPNSSLLGAIVALFNVGCFFGACVASTLASKWGRKLSIQVGCFFATVGAAIQTSAINVGQFIAGRLIAGLGIGLLSMTVPLYQAEIATPAIRGFTVGLSQQFIGLGVLASTWIVYGTNTIASDAQWQIPIGIQMVPAFLLFWGTFFLPESPRWLIAVARYERAKKVIKELYHTQEEQDKTYNEIYTEVETEKHVVSSNPMDLIAPKYWRRTLLACGGQILAQFTGINFANYYGPQVYSALGFDTQTVLLINAIYSVVGPVTNFVTITFIVDRIGRVRLMWLGSTALAIFFLLIGAIYTRFPGPTEDQKAGLVPYEEPADAHRAIIAFIFLISVTFSLSWGPIAWIYQSEIFPLKIRTMGNSAATASNWLFNIWISEACPIALSNPSVGPRFFFFFMSLNFFSAFVTFMWYPETKNKSLEMLGGALDDAPIDMSHQDDGTKKAPEAAETHITIQDKESAA